MGGNKDNLKPKTSPKARGKLGGVASGKARRQKKMMSEIYADYLSKEHPTMKPVELYVNAYLNNSDPGDVVFEPFSGSGTAIIGAENTGRKCRAVEIDPGYVAVAIQRWADATGKEPRLVE